jgi:hypothetical protein
VMGVLTGTTTAAFTGQVTATGFTGTLDGILGSGTAAAVSATTVGATGKVTAAAKLDMNGTEIILDADADTSITADTDNTIDIRIAGADDFQFTANTFTAAASSVVALDDGAVATPALTNTGDLNTGLYFPAADTVGVVTGGTEQFRFGSNPIPGSRKNLVINGNFDVWQRGTSFSTGNEYTADAWKWAGTAGSGAVSRQTFAPGQTDVPGNPTYHWRATVGTGDAAVVLLTSIEGVGLGAGVPVTVSLWAKASETTGWLDGASGATLVQRYGTGGSTATRVELDGTFQSQAITTSWQKFVATATPASISGKTVGAGNFLELYLQTDSDLASSATLDIAQVQIEFGSVATDFDDGGDFGTILNKCYRYYERLTPNTASNQAFLQTYNVQTTTASGIFHYTHKRVAPTITFTAGATFEVRHKVATTVCTAAAVSGSSDEDRAFCNFTVSSGLTAGEGSAIRRNDTDTTFIEVSAELQ